MQIEAHGRGAAMTAALKEHIERRLRFALGRFSGPVTKVTVWLSDLNGPRGGQDKQCSIQVTVPPGQVLIKDIGSEFEPVIDRAAERASRSVGRELDRRRTRRHAATDYGGNRPRI